MAAQQNVAATMRELAELRDAQLKVFSAQVALEISGEAETQGIEDEDRTEDRFAEALPRHFAALAPQLNELHGLIDSLSVKMEEVSAKHAAAGLPSAAGSTADMPSVVQVPASAVLPAPPPSAIGPAVGVGTSNQPNLRKEAR
jgi:hypothetical protein